MVKEEVFKRYGVLGFDDGRINAITEALIPLRKEGTTDKEFVKHTVDTIGIVYNESNVPFGVVVVDKRAQQG